MTEEKRFQELARRAVLAGRTGYSRFIEPALIETARKCAREAGCTVEFSGGYPGAERTVAAFVAEGDAADYPIACLDIMWNTRFSTVGHRDLLGAVMGLSIEREMTGDIVLAGDGRAYLFVIREMADYVSANLESAGRAALKIAPHEGDIICPEPEGRHIRITLASPRLDAFVSAGYDLSRSEAQRLINAGLVKLNHVPETRTDTGVDAGDLISVRGHGRMKIEELLGQTRRGRLAAQVFRYGG